MRSRTGLKSVPADFIIFDELDEAPPNAVDMALERLSHSEFKEILKLSSSLTMHDTLFLSLQQRAFKGDL